LSWTALSGATAGGSSVVITTYDIYYAVSPYTTYLPHGTSATTTYSATGLTENVLYAFEVRGNNKYGSGAFSTSITILTA
jgi:hypothetical protein